MNAAPHEVSMEEILASIRDIIAEDTPPKSTAQARSDVLELTEVVVAPEESLGLSLDLGEGIPLHDPLGRKASSLHPTHEEEKGVPKGEGKKPSPKRSSTPSSFTSSKTEAFSSADPLLSPKTQKNAAAAMATLMQATQQSHKPNPALTLDQLVLEALKPMLREWLDKHLTTIVERTVAAEIRKLVEKADF